MSSESVSTAMAHPLYVKWRDTWVKLSHVYEGSGGFMDGTYLQAHPREWLDHTSENPSKPTPKLLARRRLARYENIAAPIINSKVDALFREGPTRTSTNEEWNTWCEDIAGTGVSLSDVMMGGCRIAAIFGHTILVMDRERSPVRPKTQAEVKAPYVMVSTPLDMPDWLDDNQGRITAAKLAEAVPRTSLKTAPLAGVQRVRVIDENGWQLTDESTRPGEQPSTLVGEGVHGFGRCPVVLLYAQRRALVDVIGKPVLHDPQLFIDHYNLTSELRELLRQQTFGVLNVPLGTGPDAMGVEQAKSLIGEHIGTNMVMFSGERAGYISPDPANVKAYQDERRELTRAIYRLCNVPWEADSRDAEAEGSLKLKREDMNQVLAGYGTECEQAEYQIAELWFRGRYGEGWRAQYDAAKVVIRYPATFNVDSFADLLDQATAADGLGLKDSKTFALELATRNLSRFLPNAAVETLAVIKRELQSRQTPDERRDEQWTRMARAFATPADAQPGSGHEDQQEGRQP